MACEQNAWLYPCTLNTLFIPNLLFVKDGSHINYHSMISKNKKEDILKFDENQDQKKVQRGFFTVSWEYRIC